MTAQAVYRKRKYESLLRAGLWPGWIIGMGTLLAASFTRLSAVSNAMHTGNSTIENPIYSGYARNPALTFLHMLPGCLFLFSGAWQFIRPLRNRFIQIHRWNDRIYLLLGVITGITAIVMGIVLHFGRLSETIAVTGFGAYFLYGLLNAYIYIIKKEYRIHREWMIRAYIGSYYTTTYRIILCIYRDSFQPVFRNGILDGFHLARCCSRNMDKIHPGL